MKFDPFSRRMFLLGGGASLAIPLLGSLEPRHAKAQDARQARFVFMGHHYGRDIDRWYPAQEADEQADGVFYRSLSDISGEISHAFSSAFDPVRKKMSIIQGLDSMDFDSGHTRTQPLTASGKNSEIGFGYSLDAILEESSNFNQTLTKVGALRTSPGLSENSNSYSYSSRAAYGKVIQSEWSPHAIYDRFFNPEAIAEAAPRVERIQRVTNLVMDDFRRLHGSKAISRDDRQRLDSYMTLLTSVETRLGLEIPACQAGDPGSLDSNDQVHSAMIDLEVASLACGLTNIVTHAITQVDDDPVDDLAHHSAAHANNQMPSETEAGVSQHATYDRWVMGRVAEMLLKLDSVEEEDGSTLLDNTFFLYANGESRGFHTFYDMPVLVAGGQGKLRLGEHLDFRPRPFKQAGKSLYAGVPYNNLLITFLHGMGIDKSEYEKFGEVGFGSYRNYSRDLTDHYATHVTASGRNEPLARLYRG